MHTDISFEQELLWDFIDPKYLKFSTYSRGRLFKCVWISRFQNLTHFFFSFFLRQMHCKCADLTKNLTNSQVVDELKCLAILGKQSQNPGWLLSTDEASTTWRYVMLWHDEPDKMLPLHLDVLGNNLRQDATLDLTFLHSLGKPFWSFFLKPPSKSSEVNFSHYLMETSRIQQMRTSRRQSMLVSTRLSAFSAWLTTCAVKLWLNGTRENLMDFLHQRGLQNWSPLTLHFKRRSQQGAQERRQAVAQGREDAMRKGVGVTIERLIAQISTDATGIDFFKKITPVVTKKVLNQLQNNNFMQGHLIRQNWFMVESWWKQR